MSKPLTAQQQKIISNMSDGHWYNADSLGCKVTTMNVLRKLGYVECLGEYKPKNFKYPSMTIKWRLIKQEEEK